MILALDTSTLALSMALCDGPRLVEHVVIHPPRKQSEMLPGEAGLLLARHEVTLPSLDALVVGLGPGSFTGLRISVATFKAFAYAARVPLSGASSLAAVACDGPEGEELWTIAVARVDELYLGRYRRLGDGVEKLADEDALTPPELAERARANPHALILGPATVDYRAKLMALGVDGARILEVGQVPSAVHLARLAEKPAAFELQKVFSLEPHYVRGSSAERNPKFPPLPGPAPVARIRED